MPHRIVTPLTEHAGIDVPLICGAMYPCSNPELVGAVSAAGAIGIMQPISLTYVHGHDYREGIRLTYRLSGGKPIGMNVLIEASSKAYLERMRQWVDIALEEGIRFFITSLGNPKWVVERVAPLGGIVYHDVTERKWAEKGLQGGVHGLIAVNNRAGGHAGGLSAERLIEDLRGYGVPVVCAGGIGHADDFVHALRLGYAGAQLGTRFIATTECTAHPAYKQAILDAGEDDIILTERITGVPVSLIRTPHIERTGTRAGPVARWMLRGRKTKHLMRTIYALRSLQQLKRSSMRGAREQDYWQAGKSVEHIDAIVPAGEIVRQFAGAAREAGIGNRETERAGASIPSDPPAEHHPGLGTRASPIPIPRGAQAGGEPAGRHVSQAGRRAPYAPDERVSSSIVGFHTDDEGHWVADLACGHTQHVRHDPPWQVRPWVTTPEGRAEWIGRDLGCVKCARGEP